jgi:hypothetical protein
MPYCCIQPCCMPRACRRDLGMIWDGIHVQPPPPPQGGWPSSNIVHQFDNSFSLGAKMKRGGAGGDSRHENKVKSSEDEWQVCEMTSRFRLWIWGLREGCWGRLVRYVEVNGKYLQWTGGISHIPDRDKTKKNHRLTKYIKERREMCSEKNHGRVYLVFKSYRNDQQDATV